MFVENDMTFFFFNDTATTEIYTLSLHDALPILDRHTRVAAGDDVPAPIRWTPDGEVRLPIAIIITRHRHVLYAVESSTQLLGDRLARAAAGGDVPASLGGPPHAYVGPSLPLKIRPCNP